MANLSSFTLNIDTVGSNNDYYTSAAVLDNGDYLVSWSISNTPGGSASQSAFELFDHSGASLGGEQFNSSLRQTSALALGGGFALIGQASNGHLEAQFYDGGGAAQGGLVDLVTPPPVPQGAATNLTVDGTARLANGDFVVTWTETDSYPYEMNNPQNLMMQVFDPSGHPVNAPVTVLGSGTIDGPFGASVAALAGGGFAEVWVQQGQAREQIYDASGHAVGSTLTLGNAAAGDQLAVVGLSDGSSVVAWAGGALDYVHVSADGTAGALHTLQTGNYPSYVGAAALAGGGYVISWTDGGYATDQFIASEHAQAFNASDQTVGAAATLASGLNLVGPSAVAVDSSGHALVAWSNTFVGQPEVGEEQAVLLDVSSGAVAPVSPTSEQLVAFGSAVTLSGAAGWTSAAVLANHDLAVVGAQAGAYGSQTGFEVTYDASGNETASTSLMGYSGAGETLTPEVSALGGSDFDYGSGFGGAYYQVNYAGSTDNEVYNAGDHQVSFQNQYTSQTGVVAPMEGYGYMKVDTSTGAYGIFDSNDNNIAWGQLRAAPEVINGDTSSGLAIGYANSTAIDFFYGGGSLQGTATLGASNSSFAMAIAGSARTGTQVVWLSADGGQDGLATSIDFQSVGVNGSGPVVSVAQDLDPWHTVFRVQADDSVTTNVLWSEGGGVFGAQVDTQTNAVSAVHAAVAGDLSTTVTTALVGDTVGLAWMQNGDAWAEIFNPATGAVERVDLGAATGDFTSLHLLATINGGMAVSWHEGSEVLGAVLSSSGALGPTTVLPGDLLGVDTHGHALTVHDVGGNAVLQAVGINDTLFWVH